MLSSPLARQSTQFLRPAPSSSLLLVAGNRSSRTFSSASQPRPAPDAGKDDDEYSPEELKAARSWLAQLSPNSIPRNICDVSYSRSSGPGGQNVNKVNSKATLKIPLKSLLPIVPRVLHPSIHSSRHLANQSASLVIQSDESRKQSKNLDLCYGKLQDLLVAAGKSAIRGETSAEQKNKVKKLEKANNEARIKMKKAHSNKKSGRRSKGDD